MSVTELQLVLILVCCFTRLYVLCYVIVFTRILLVHNLFFYQKVVYWMSSQWRDWLINYLREIPMYHKLFWSSCKVLKLIAYLIMLMWWCCVALVGTEALPNSSEWYSSCSKRSFGKVPWWQPENSSSSSRNGVSLPHSGLLQKTLSWTW